jgi:hypothetical protein
MKRFEFASGVAYRLLRRSVPSQSQKGVLTMKNAKRVVLTTVSALAFTATGWGIPREIPNARPDTTKEQNAAQPQSVTGKIASFDKSSLTLNVVASQINASGLQPAQQAAKTMTFLIDKNTTVEGTLKVDSNAAVTYREDNGSNIAISVSVTP